MLRLKSRSIFVQWTLLHNARENVKKVLLEWVFAYQLQQTLGIDKFTTVFQDRHSIFKGLNDSDASDCFSIHGNFNYFWVAFFSNAKWSKKIYVI